MKELNSKTRRAILDYRERHRNNDIVVVMKGMKDKSYVFYAGTDLLNYNVTDNDPKLVLTRLDCHIFNKNCSSKVLPWQEAAFFSIVSKESGENFSSTMDSRPTTFKYISSSFCHACCHTRGRLGTGTL